jgi:predicted SprT family Zn-dependent metalloprotease
MAKTKVVYKRLRTAWGYAYINQNKIALWNKLKDPKYAKKHLEILIHEKLHIMYPDMDETAIERDGKDLSNFLWDQGCRIKNDS